MHRLAFVLALFSSLLVASWLRPASGATGLETAFVSNTETVPLDPPARDLPKAGPDWDPNG